MHRTPLLPPVDAGALPPGVWYRPDPAHADRTVVTVVGDAREILSVGSVLTVLAHTDANRQAFHAWRDEMVAQLRRNRTLALVP